MIWYSSYLTGNAFPVGEVQAHQVYMQAQEHAIDRLVSMYGRSSSHWRVLSCCKGLGVSRPHDK